MCERGQTSYCLRLAQVSGASSRQSGPDRPNASTQAKTGAVLGLFSRLVNTQGIFSTSGIPTLSLNTPAFRGPGVSRSPPTFLHTQGPSPSKSLFYNNKCSTSLLKPTPRGKGGCSPLLLPQQNTGPLCNAIQPYLYPSHPLDCDLF